MAADIDIFPTEGNVRGPLIGSVALHGALFALALFGYLIPSGRGESWGGTSGGGGAMSATLVSSIPLPTPPTQTQNVLANQSKGLAQSKPKETPKEEPKALPIPERDTKRKGPHDTTQKKPPPKEIAKAEDNKIPFGEGGPVSGPYGSFTSGSTKGGLSFTGGTGDFGSRFGWYVSNMKQAIGSNWYHQEVNSATPKGARVYLVFTIHRDGTATDMKFAQGSGSPTLDRSCLRALQRVDSFGALPSAYLPSSLNVSYYCEY